MVDEDKHNTAKALERLTAAVGQSQAGEEADKKARVEAAKLEAYVAIWSKAVDTQMHFNEMSVKSRQLGLTFVAAALGVGVVLLSRHDDFSVTVNLFGASILLHVSVLIILAAAGAVYGVRILDLSVYHRMLRGAVTFGEDFEENYMKQIFELEKGMTQTISHYSRFDDASCVSKNRKYSYSGEKRLSAEVKIRRFYRFVIISLLVSAFIIFAATSSRTISPTAPASPPASPQEGGSGAATHPAPANKAIEPAAKREQVPATIEKKESGADVNK